MILCLFGGGGGAVVVPFHLLTVYFCSLAACSVHEKNFSLRKYLLSEKQSFVERLD